MVRAPVSVMKCLSYPTVLVAIFSWNIDKTHSILSCIVYCTSSCVTGVFISYCSFRPNSGLLIYCNMKGFLCSIDIQNSMDSLIRLSCIWNEQLHNSIELFCISCGGISCLTMDHYFDRWNISIFMENRCGSLWEMKQFNLFVCITFGNYGHVWHRHVWILKYITMLHNYCNT